MKLCWFSVAFGMVLLASSWAAAQGQKPLSKESQAVVQGNNEFAFDLYKQLRKEEGNLFFSPYSISSALGMTYAGARAETADQMASTLHFPFEQAKLHPAFKEVVELLNARGEKRPYQLSVANRLWGQKGYDFAPEFLKTTEDNYHAGLQQLDFSSETEKARLTINGWVEKETQDKIKDLIPSGALANDTRLVLTNAIYFKSPWFEPFIKQATKDGNFQTGTESVKVPMMHKHDTMAYMENEQFQAVSIGYKGNQLSMVVLLPRKGKTLENVEVGLTDVKFRGYLGGMRTRMVDLKLPRFKMTSKFQMKKVLSEMGMPLAFSDNADFTGMTSREKLKIDQVIHKAFVDVNEEGTEAAAATAVIMRPTSAAVNPLPPVNFHADRPFLFLIRENVTGSVLFMGRVSNPKG
jgi:serpin B